MADPLTTMYLPEKRHYHFHVEHLEGRPLGLGLQCYCRRCNQPRAWPGHATFQAVDMHRGCWHVLPKEKWRRPVEVLAFVGQCRRCGVVHIFLTPPVTLDRPG